MTHENTPPIWFPLSVTALARLTAPVPPAPELEEDDASDLDGLEPGPGAGGAMRAPDAAASMIDLLHASAAALQARDEAALGEDLAEATSAAEPAPAPRPAPRDWHDWSKLSAGLRLAALFGTEAGVAAALEDGAITTVDGIPVADLTAAREAFQRGLLPEGVAAFQQMPTAGVVRGVLLLAPTLDSDGSVSKTSASRFWQTLDRALTSSAPLLALLPAGFPASPAHARALPAARELPRLDAAMLAMLLRVIYSDDPVDDIAWPDVAALAARLPAAADLATVSDTQIQVALRAPTAEAAADRIAAAAAAARPTGDLSALAGMGELEAAAKDLVADLRGWQEGTVAWAQMTRSLLLFGPPGTGKTHAAAEIARAAGAAFFPTSLSQWQAAGHLGDTLRAMRMSFSEARAAAPSILFLDEIDSFGIRMDQSGKNENYQRQVVNALLEEINGQAQAEGCVMIAATNAPEQIDPAITRPGRFDRLVEVGLPGPAAVAQMLGRLLDGALPAADVAALSVAARGQTPAAIDAALRAARGTARRQRRQLEAADVRAALAPPHPMPDDLIRRIAAHEAGHAIACSKLGLGTVHAVRLTPLGGQTEAELRPSAGLLAEIEERLTYQLSGRAAEALITGTISGGAGGPEGSDLAKATCMALSADLSLGLKGSLAWRPTDPAALDDPDLRARVEAQLAAAEARATALLRGEMVRLQALTAALARERALEGEALAGLLHGPLATAVGPMPHDPRPAHLAAADAPDPAAAADGPEAQAS